MTMCTAFLLHVYDGLLADIMLIGDVTSNTPEEHSKGNVKPRMLITICTALLFVLEHHVHAPQPPDNPLVCAVNSFSPSMCQHELWAAPSPWDDNNGVSHSPEFVDSR